MKTIRLTMTQAIVRYLSSQYIETDEGVQPIFAGVFAIFRPWKCCWNWSGLD
jgi:3D-(3,5/4)-trihydroxycyclohexane-1,2-dione acylhydrolase (decyclizing)